MSEKSEYCPICRREIVAELVHPLSDEWIYIHDPIPHDENDIKALEAGIQ